MNYVSIIRATLKGSPKEAQMAHDAAFEQLSAMTRPLGAIGHKAHINPQNQKEFLAIDTWNNMDGLQKFLNDTRVMESLGQMFDGRPDITVWEEAGWAGF